MATKNKSVNVSILPKDGERASHAFKMIRTKIDALDQSKVISVNVDIAYALSIGFGALPEIQKHRALIVRMPDYPAEEFDAMETYALATLHAHGNHLAASTPTASIPPLAEEGTKLRNWLVANAEVHAERGVFDAQTIASVKSGQGYRDTAEDLEVLASMYRANWAQLEGKTAVQLSEVDSAASIAERLLIAVGVREHGPAQAEETAAIRQRAFTLFVRAYDQARDALAYLRREENDANRIAPSLFARSGAGAPKKEPAPPPPAVDPAVNAKPAPISGPPFKLPQSEPFTR